MHHHHAYWRLDFDIATAGNNVVREFNKPSIIGNSNYHDKSYEIRRPRDSSHERHWEISNLRIGDTYSLIPGLNDGASDAFGVGDLWVLRYHPNELNGGVAATTGSTDAAKANIDKFLNGEPTVDKDVVMGLILSMIRIMKKGGVILWARLSYLSSGREQRAKYLFWKVE